MIEAVAFIGSDEKTGTFLHRTYDCYGTDVKGVVNLISKYIIQEKLNCTKNNDEITVRARIVNRVTEIKLNQSPYDDCKIKWTLKD